MVHPSITQDFQFLHQVFEVDLILILEHVSDLVYRCLDVVISHIGGSLFGRFLVSFCSVVTFLGPVITCFLTLVHGVSKHLVDIFNELLDREVFVIRLNLSQIFRFVI